MAKHSNFKSFGLAVIASSKEIKEKEESRILSAVFNGLNTAVLVTPKDTGLAQNNWNIQNKLDTKTILEKPSTKKINYSNPIYLVNNLPYIKKLDEGSSQQAPNGMTQDITKTISDSLRKK